MAEKNVEEIVGARREVIMESWSLSMRFSHGDDSSLSPPPFFQTSAVPSPSHAIFAFSPSFSLHDSPPPPSAEDNALAASFFPALRSVGGNQSALLHPPFVRRFHQILTTSTFDHQVHRAILERKQIIFTGHSFGGAVATLATIWLLQQPPKFGNLAPTKQNLLPLCITFGSPLVGDALFGHALRREDWADRIVNLVHNRDLVPRALLASLDQNLEPLLNLLEPGSRPCSFITAGPQQASYVYTTVARSAAYVATHVACALMGSTSSLLEMIPGFVRISPYRPAGTYLFCAGNGRLVAVKNPDAILQLLFYCLQVGEEESVAEVALKSLQDHLGYESTTAGIGLEPTNVVVCLDNLEKIPLSFEDSTDDDRRRLVHVALKELGVSIEGRLCLRAAGALEKQKIENQAKIDANYNKIEEALKFLQLYRSTCSLRSLNYYDSFKLQRDTQDFNANLKRLQLAGLFDEIIDMLKRYELPEGFESRMEWVALGTKYRRLVEPLDIANYYRHSLNEDTGPYLIKGRPTRYQYTQRWLERAHRLPTGSASDSCFWGRVEELCTRRKAFEEMESEVLGLEREVLGWVNNGEMERDVLLEGSTFVKWWRTLPHEHRIASCIGKLVDG